MDRTNWAHGTQPLNLLVLVAGRECLGRHWFEFLRHRQIRRCIRVKGGARVDGDRLDEVDAGLPAG